MFDQKAERVYDYWFKLWGAAFADTCRHERQTTITLSPGLFYREVDQAYGQLLAREEYLRKKLEGARIKLFGSRHCKFVKNEYQES